MTLRFSLSIFLTCASLASQAASIPDLQQLAQDPYWLSLGHYKTTRSGHRSDIKEDTFFLAADGKTNPYGELEATLESLKQSDQLACQYPARFNWLQEQGVLQGELPECTEFVRWREEVAGHSLKLIFPSAYINNPESMFGHVLLRVDQADQSSRENLNAYAINFAATPDEGDNPLLYAVKGFTGHYPGSFTLMPYYRKVKEYSDFESRDIWEFELNFTPAEVSRILDHAWELNGVTFDYYYLNRNCNYQLLALLELGREGLDLTSQYRYRAVPTDAFAALEEQGMLIDTAYRPAYGTRLLHQADEIDTKLLPVVRKAMSGSLPDDSLTVQDQAAALELAYEWLNFLYYHDASMTRTETSQTMSSLLLERSRLPVPASFSVPPTPEHTPVAAHGSARAGYGLNHQVDGRSQLSLHFRASYHDLMDRSSGYLPGAQISFLESEVAVDDQGSLSVEKAYLVDVMALPPSNNILNPWAWHLRAGYDRQMNNQGRYFVQHGYGKAYQFDGLHLHGLISGTLATGPAFERSMLFGVGGEVGAVYSINSDLKLGVNSEYAYFADHSSERFFTSDFSVQWSPSRSHSIKGFVRHKGMQDSRFEFGVTAYQYF